MKIVVRAKDNTTHTFDNQTKDQMDYALMATSLGRGFTLVTGRSTVAFAPGTVERVIGDAPAAGKEK